MGKEILIGEEPHGKQHKQRGRGRPSTIRVSLRQELWDTHVSPHLPEIYEIVVEAARDGDMDAIKMLMPRVIPTNPMAEPLKIEATAAKTMENILHYAAQGHCTLEDAVKLTTIVKDRATVVEMAALSDKLKAFEIWMADQQGGVNGNILEGSVENVKESRSAGKTDD